LGNQRPPVIQSVEKEILKSLITLATEDDADLVEEMRDCMRRMPWSLIEGVDESESSWFQPPPDQNSGDGPPGETPQLSAAVTQNNGGGSMNIDSDRNESQTQNVSEDMVPPHLSTDGVDEDMDRRLTQEQSEDRPQGRADQERADQDMVNVAQTQNLNASDDRPPSEKDDDQDMADAAQTQNLNASDDRAPSGQDDDQDMADAAQTQNASDNRPPDRQDDDNGKGNGQRQDNDDDAMDTDGDEASRGAKAAPSRKGNKPCVPPSSENIDSHGEARNRDPRLRPPRNELPPNPSQGPGRRKYTPLKQNQIVPPPPESDPITIHVKRKEPPLNPKPSGKRLKGNKKPVSGSSIKEAIDVDKLFVSIIAPPSLPCLKYKTQDELDVTLDDEGSPSVRSSSPFGLYFDSTPFSETPGQENPWV
jgi:hypothetical protein